MAKKSKNGGSGGSVPPRGAKSAAIRQYLKAHKSARPKEVVAALKAQGTEVSPNMVSIIRAKAGVKKARRKATQAVADHDKTAGSQMTRAAALEAALTLYKAAQGMETAQPAIRKAFLRLVDVLG